MYDVALIDPKTASKEGMTPLETEAVMEMWRLQKRLEAQASGVPHTSGFLADEPIPQKDLRRLLRTVRATYPVTARTPRSLVTDVRLAIAVVLAFLAVLGGVFGYMGGRRSQAAFPVVSVQQDAWGMTLTSHRYSAPFNWFRNASTSPERFAFLKDTTLYEPIHPMGRETKDDQLRSALRNVVGGPLADSSSLTQGNVDSAELKRVLDAGPSRMESNGPYVFDGPSTPRAFRTERLIVWQEVSVAFGGKVVTATFPYARASDVAVRKAVQEKQAQLIEQLVKAATAVSRR